MEWKLFAGDVPFVSTFDYHKDRDRAPHIDQSDHKPRMRMALEFVLQSRSDLAAEADCEPDFRVVDLGCGDGGFVAAVHKAVLRSEVLGFDFTPDMKNGWMERGVYGMCRSRNVFPVPPDPSVINQEVIAAIATADVVVMTEVLEHLARPHEVLDLIGGLGRIDIVASSPWGETDRSHDPSHAWAWDQQGYVNMIENAGFDILDYARAGFSQVVRARSRG